jgi:hypothetical protein
MPFSAIKYDESLEFSSAIALHAIWSYKERSYKEPALRFEKKEPVVRILGLKNRFTFYKRLFSEISERSL